MKILLSLLILLFAAPVNAQLMIGGGRVGTAINGFSYCREVRVDHTKVSNTVFPPADLSNFPVLFDSKINAGLQADLKLVANGGVVTDAEGDDIVFYPDALGGAGGAKLDHEVDFYSGTTGEGIFHVRRDLSAVADAVFWICYGKSAITTDQSNKTAVWNEGYAAVYHFRTVGGSLDVTDSTINGLGGKSFGTTTITPGKLAGAALFIDPDNDFVSIGSPGFTLTSNRTFEFWYHLNAAPMPSSDSPKFGIYKKVGASSGTEISITNRVGPGCRAEFSSGAEGAAQVRENIEAFAGDTKHCAVVYNRDAHKIYLYVNGLAGEAYDYYPSAEELIEIDYIGQGMIGWIDEPRVSNVARPYDYLRTSYLMQLNPALMVSVGPRL